ncbi:hypothetical protein [Nocardia nova]|nr:hypothetical protein [Nocardia nova]
MVAARLGVPAEEIRDRTSGLWWCRGQAAARIYAGTSEVMKTIIAKSLAL